MARLVRPILGIFSRINQKFSANFPQRVSCANFPRTVTSLVQPTPYEVVDPKQQEKDTKEIVSRVNEQIKNGHPRRLFAVVHVGGKQFKITAGDVIVVEGYWPPDTGDKIRLNKVLLVGGEEFSLIGRPLVEDGLVDVEATVVEKTLSHTKTHFRKKRRKQYMRIHFYRIPQTMLRINSINIGGELDKPKDVTGLENALF